MNTYCKLITSLFLAFNLITSFAQTLEEIQQRTPIIYDALKEMTGVWLNENENVPIGIFFENNQMMISIENDNGKSQTPIELTGMDEDLTMVEFNIPLGDEVHTWQLHKIYTDDTETFFNLVLVIHSGEEIPLTFIQEIINESSVNDYASMTFEDLLLDAKNLIGQKIKVTTKANYTVQMLHLWDDNQANSISVNTDNLTREERKLMLNNCNRICNVTLYGTVQLNYADIPEIDAYKVEL